MNSTTARIAILIITRNRCETLKCCLEQIARQNYPANLISVFIHDDASTDATASEIPALLETMKTRTGFAHVRYLRSDTRSGITAGRRTLANLTTDEHDLALFLDDDVYLEPATLTVLAGYMASHADTGAIGPRSVLASDPETPILAGLFIHRWIGAYIGLSAENPTKCHALDPLCLLVRRSALLAAGGFSDAFYRSHEGIDLCLSMREKGFTVVYHPGTTVQHDTVIAYPSKERLYYLYRNKIIVAHRHFTRAQFRLISAITLCIRLPIYLLRSVRYRGMIDRGEWSVIIQAVRDGVKGVTGKKEFPV